MDQPHGRRPARLGEAELRAVLEGLPDATVAADVDGRVVFVNGRAEELFGYSAGELLGRPVEIIWPERVRERYTRNMRLYFATEHPLRFTSEARGLRKDGSEFVGEMSWGTVETSDGRLLLAIGRDISARREALARLRRQSEQQAAVAALGERALTGDDLRELAGEAVARLREMPGLTRAVVTAGAGGEVLAGWGEAGAGEELELELRTAARLLGRLTVGAERELDDDERSYLRAIAHMLTLAGERAAAEERLRQAQKMAAVGRLAGGVAHDFNNLLTAISGFVAIARAKVGEGAGARELEEAERATARAAEVTRQLLAVSRRQVLEPALVDLGAVARELAPMLRRLIGSHVELVLDVDRDVPPVLADRGQLSQVVLNLAVNAGDAMPGGGRLTIATARLGGDVGFVVTDTGHGMGPDVLEHAFEPFFTTKAPGEGTGLGLATVQGIVEQSGGRVSVRSNPGAGAEFTVAFPSADAGAGAADRPAAADGERLHGDETVLLCEDETAVRQLMEHVLAAHGYRVLPAALPSEALEIALTHPSAIDLLLTDVIMPEMAGPELAERVRAVRPGLPTLFVSGYTAETLGDRGELPPGTAFVEKPFAAGTLLRALRGLLD